MLTRPIPRREGSDHVYVRHRAWAWDTPATVKPVIEPLESAGHEVIVVDLPCDRADATLEEYANAVRAVLPNDLTEVVLVGYSFGGFTASRIAADHPELPVVYVAAWIPRDGTSVLDLFAGGDPFERDAVRTYLEQTQRPQGIAVLREKWRGAPPASRRRTYVLTTADTLVPPEAQRAMAGSLSADVVEIDADHGVFREQPVRLAKLLVAAAR